AFRAPARRRDPPETVCHWESVRRLQCARGKKGNVDKRDRVSGGGALAAEKRFLRRTRIASARTRGGSASRHSRRCDSDRAGRGHDERGVDRSSWQTLPFGSRLNGRMFRRSSGSDKVVARQSAVDEQLVPEIVAEQGVKKPVGPS